MVQNHPMYFTGYIIHNTNIDWPILLYPSNLNLTVWFLHKTRNIKAFVHIYPWWENSYSSQAWPYTIPDHPPVVNMSDLGTHTVATKIMYKLTKTPTCMCARTHTQLFHSIHLQTYFNLTFPPYNVHNPFTLRPSYTKPSSRHSTTKQAIQPWPPTTNFPPPS